MNNIHDYLDKYGQEVLVVHRPTTDYWPRRGPDRCLYKSSDYDPLIKYNHRSIMPHEVVVEFDEEDKNINERKAFLVALRLAEQGYGYSLWWSGNKSYHVHTLVNIGGYNDRALVKRLFTILLCEGLGKPDMQLCHDNHLIRAEFGLHEKTGEYKTLVTQSKNYFKPKKLPSDFEELYNLEQRKRIARKALRNGSYKAHPGVRALLNTHDFKTTVGDGHQRGLYLLSNILRFDWQDDLEGFVKFLQEWYKVSGGNKLRPDEVEKTVRYQVGRNYNRFSISKVEDILDDIGVQYKKEEKPSL